MYEDNRVSPSPQGVKNNEYLATIIFFPWSYYNTFAILFVFGCTLKPGNNAWVRKEVLFTVPVGNKTIQSRTFIC